MNKTIALLCAGLSVVGAAVYAMESAPAQATCTVTKEVASVVADSGSKVCSSMTCGKLCPIRKGFAKAWTLCKKHPICVAAGMAVVAIAIVYHIPAIKEKVNGFFGN